LTIHAPRDGDTGMIDDADQECGSISSQESQKTPLLVIDQAAVDILF
jgi:hypothetical protein